MAFDGCSSLTSVTIPNGVTYIGSDAFSGCSSLTSVTIPNSVTSIGSDAFSGCSGLKKVIVNDIASWCNLSFYYASTNPLSNAHHLYSDENTEISDLVIPNSVTRIGDYAFNGCSGLTSVTIPNSVTSIGKYAFSGCSGLTSVTIPESVTSIGDYAFSGCSGLTSVTIPESVTSISGYAFSGCSSLTSVTIPNSVTSIGGGAFRGCSGLTSVTIPNSVTRIGDYAFNGCSSLTSVTIPNSVTSIGRNAFQNCGLTSITIPESVTSIDYDMFKGCSSLTSVTIENTRIGYGMFDGCSSLTSVTISNNVRFIGWFAFNNCSSLTSVTIPNSVTSIGNGAFKGCSGLTSVKVGMESPLTTDFGAFTNRSNATLYVPKGSKSAYQSANCWKDFKSIVEFPNADVNQDGKVNVVDVVDIARFVVDTPSDKFVEFLADLNSDDEVNVADAVVLVNEIAGDVNFAKAYGAPRQDLGDDHLTLAKNDDHSLSLAMESQRPYTAFQFDLYTNSEDDVMAMALNAARKNGHQLLYNKMDEGHYRVVALSLANNGFNGNNGELLNIQLDGFNSADMTIGNIHFITGDGTDYLFDDLRLSNATGIEGLTSNPSTKDDGNVYDLSGRKVSVPSANDESTVLPKGIYIKNGRKVVVK